jgi:hypothetical protein
LIRTLCLARVGVTQATQAPGTDNAPAREVGSHATTKTSNGDKLTAIAAIAGRAGGEGLAILIRIVPVADEGYYLIWP